MRSSDHGCGELRRRRRKRRFSCRIASRYGILKFFASVCEIAALAYSIHGILALSYQMKNPNK